ncbi:MAG: aminotransferase class V-fold PLP-dependent enzyme [Bacteroidia bacterium]|nr:aminotransferase class V-fold PLP-dependent enzyme [Bacteroidia bacterium]MDW8158562.1 aminotransferase class V-fold PLP-dependent enzyme [Bacteroidia bacterium]
MNRYYFTPGPSQLEPGIEIYFRRALQNGILSTYHRSEAFSNLYRKIHKLCQEKLQLPASYSLYFFSSATECWSVLSESVVQAKSLHICNGAFAQKWAYYAGNLHPIEKISIEALEEKDHILPLTDLLCITLNETSNGSFFPFSLLAKIRGNLPNQLIALDVTSCLGGIEIPWELGDFWFGSVQKCLGLPSGLALFFASPAAVERINTQRKSNLQYNSLFAVHQNFLKYQTTHTPNILNIFLLSEVLENRQSIESISKDTYYWASCFYKVLASLPELELCQPNPLFQSPTIITCTAREATIKQLHEYLLLQHNIVIGQGYGKDCATSFRIANFPQMPPTCKAQLIEILVDFFGKKFLNGG